MFTNTSATSGVRGLARFFEDHLYDSRIAVDATDGAEARRSQGGGELSEVDVVERALVASARNVRLPSATKKLFSSVNSSSENPRSAQDVRAGIAPGTSAGIADRNCGTERVVDTAVGEAVGDQNGKSQYCR